MEEMISASLTEMELDSFDQKCSSVHSKYPRANCAATLHGEAGEKPVWRGPDERRISYHLLRK